MLPGVLRNYNTIEEFKRADKTKLLSDLGDQVRVPSTVERQLYERSN